jgi:hypothetical protein
MQMVPDGIPACVVKPDWKMTSLLRQVAAEPSQYLLLG